MRYFKPLLMVICLHCILFVSVYIVSRFDRDISIETPLAEYQVDLFSLSKAKKVSKKKSNTKKHNVKKEKKKEKKEEIREKGFLPKVNNQPKKEVKEFTEKSYQENELDNKNIKPFRNRIPKYPKIAKENNIEGFVLFKLLVDERGKILVVKVIKYSGHSQFVNEALKVAKQWTFPALTRGGRRVKAWITQKVRFQLKER